MEIFLLILFLLIALLYFFKNSRNGDFFGFFLLTSILFYLIYPLLDIINESYIVEEEDFILIYLYIIITTIIIKALSAIFLPRGKKQFLSLNYINTFSNEVSFKDFLLLNILTFSIIAYFFINDGFIFRIITTNYNDKINTYNIVIGSIVIPLLYVIQIIAFNKFLKDKKLIYLIFTIIIVLYFLFYGRRELIQSLIFIVYIFLNDNKVKILSFKTIFIFIITVLFIVFGSNFYQNIREDIFMYSVTGEINFDRPISELIFDLNASKKNINERFSLLYNFKDIIINVKQSNLSEGKVLLENFKTSIPSIIYHPEKVSINEDAIIAETFKIKPTDFSASIGSLFLMDFSYLALFFYPIFMVFSWKIFNYLIEQTQKYSKTLALISLVSILYLFFNIEGNMSDVFVRIETSIILLIMAFLYFILTRRFKSKKVKFTIKR